MTEISRYSEWARDVPVSTARPAFWSYLTIGCFVAAFGYWAATAPLEGAAVVPGVVAAAGRNIVVQHLEGGIIADVVVREGDRVKAGAELFRLDPTLSQAQKMRLTNQASAFKARVARLEAERDGLEQIAFPQELSGVDDAETKAILTEQTSLFQETIKRHKSELDILGQRQSALTESLQGLVAQKKAAEDQLAIVDEEIARKRKLLDKGLTDRSQFTALMRNQAELLGQIGQATAQLASTNTQILEAKQQLARAAATRVEAASKELTEVKRQLADVNEQIVAASNVLDRVVIRAPVDGIIVKQSVNAAGIVIRPGEPLLELLPTTDDLIIEARLDPRDVDAVGIGQEARLRFVALNMRATPDVAGKVTYVSPDRLIDEATQTSYYSVRLKIDGDLPAEVKPEQIYPGTPVEGFISTGDRTFFEYLAKPIQDSFQRAFREE